MSDEQRELLISLGLKAPEEPQPDLTALCKQHISSLPEDTRKLLEDPPEKPPTPQEVMSETSKKFKIATAELRDLIFKKSALQLRLKRGGRVHRSEFWSLCYLFSSAFIPKTVLFRFMIFMIRFSSFIYFAHNAWIPFVLDAWFCKHT